MYRNVIVVTKIAERRTSKAQSIKTKNILNNINKINRLTMGQFSKVL